jgi:hypothetical protein
MASKKKTEKPAPVRWYTPTESADMVGVTPQTLRRWAKAGRVDSIKLPSGQSRYNMDAFIRSLGGTKAIHLPPPRAAAQPARKPVQQPQQPAIPRQSDLVEEINRIASSGNQP